MYQTAPSIWTIGRDKPVILGVPFLSHTSPIKKLRGVAKPDFHLCIPCRSEYSQTSFYLRTQLQISNLDEFTIGPWRYLFSRVPPQPNCPPAGVPRKRWALSQQMSSITYFAPLDPKIQHRRSYLFYAPIIIVQQQVAVKVHKVSASHKATPAFSPVSEFRRYWLGTVTISLNHSCTSPFRWQGITLNNVLLSLPFW